MRTFVARCAFLAVVFLALTSASLAAQHRTKPGVERWPIKTSLPDGTDVKHSKHVSYTDLAKFSDPEPAVAKNDHRYQSVRIPAFSNPLGVKEGDLLTVTAWVHLVAGESDGDYHIQISDSQGSQASCVIVEVPNPEPAFVKDANLRPHFAAVRDFMKTKLLKGNEPSATGSLMQRPPYVHVTGQLFYDDAHVGTPPRGKKGCKAATLWELHPVTDMKFAPVPR